MYNYIYNNVITICLKKWTNIFSVDRGINQKWTENFSVVFQLMQKSPQFFSQSEQVLSSHANNY